MMKVASWSLACGWLCMGCSFLYSRPPPSGPVEGAGAARASNPNIGSRKGCDAANPIYDLTWVAGGIGWVLLANRLEEPPSQPAGTTSPIDADTPPHKDYSGLRYVGYGQMAFFGASTLWGLYVVARCSGARNAERRANAAAAAADQEKSRRKGDLPSAVLGFTFGMTGAQAESACRSQLRDYLVDGALATCTSRTTPDNARLHFSFGALSEVTAYYQPPREQLAKYYDQLYLTLISKYGPPQADRVPLSAECQTALADCLERGVTVKGPAWAWPKGSVTLTPTWNTDHAEIDVRYARVESGE